jgi:hypothetical protein
MKLKLEHPSNRLLIFILILIVAVQTALLGFFGLKINTLWDTVNGYGSPKEQINNSLASLPVKSYIQDSLVALYRNDTVTDAGASKVYIPELKIYLPFNQLARDLKYAYTDDPTTSAGFSTKILLSHPIQRMNDIPCVQTFAGLTVNKDDPPSWQNSENAGTVKLKDGRTLYLYKNNLKNCVNLWAGITPDNVVDLLKQARSY